MDETSVRAQTREFLMEVLRRFREEHADTTWTGLAVDCPYAGGVFVCVCDEDASEYAYRWAHTYIEQDVGDIDGPLWLDEFQDLQEQDFFAALPEAERRKLRETPDPPGAEAVADLLALPLLYEQAAEDDTLPVMVLFEKPGYGDEKFAESLQEIMSAEFQALATAHFRCRRANLALPEHAPLRDKYRANMHQYAVISRQGRQLGMRGLVAGDVNNLAQHLQVLIKHSRITAAEWQARDAADVRQAAAIKAAHAMIQAAVAAALHDMQQDGTLTQLGFTADCVLSVLDE